MYEARVVHHIPGRMRIKLPSLKGSSAYSEQIHEALLPIEGLTQVDFNPITGSVLLHYDPEAHEHFSEQLADYVQRTMGLNLVGATSTNEEDASETEAEGVVVTAVIGHTKLTREITTFFNRINEEVRAATDDAADLRSLLPLGLAIYALSKIGSTMSTPFWVTLSIFSFTSFNVLNPVSITVEPEHKQGGSVRGNNVERKPKTSS